MVTKHELARALSRRYAIRGQNRSFAVTLPPAIAEPFIAKFGPDVIYEIVEEGVLMKPAPEETDADLPSWMSSNGAEPKKKSQRRTK